MTREDMIDEAVRQATSRDLRQMYAKCGYVIYSRKLKIVRQFIRIAAREASQ